VRHPAHGHRPEPVERGRGRQRPPPDGARAGSGRDRRVPSDR
jgi:hypothetical protein